ncbi:MAG TPA: hypothetical protein VFB74_10615 [Kribbellaceae bacterium]|nr:hypothetical protein [Kribbellaceae bacterium]
MTADPASSFRYLGEPTGIDSIGIALSGGGVRAACLGLGALQVAEESGVLNRARYVSAVSGGSYTAVAFLSARAQIPVDAPPTDGVAPWCRGSPEEAHLRRNLRYLGEDPSDLFLAAVRYCLTLLINLIPFVAAIVLGGALAGLGYQLTDALMVRDDRLGARYVGGRWIAAACVAVAAVILLESRSTPASIQRRVRRTATVVVAALVMPELIVVVTRALDSRTFDIAAVTRLAALSTLLLVIATLVFRSQWAFTPSLPREIIRRVLRFAFAALMLAVFWLPLLLVAAQASQSAPATILLVTVAALAILLLFGLVIHANQTSLHRPYASRLNRAYVVWTGRGSSANDSADDTADDRADDTVVRGDLRLSEVPLEATHRTGLPQLLICASINLRESESAEGEGCASLVFSSDYVGGAATGSTVDPAVFKRLDCATLVAASGAAVAPNMGRYTRRASRAALALINLRLGLWLHNPLQPSAENSGGRIRSWALAGWREPGPLATWREALGDLSIKHRYVFVSDGGHWDNSGIVELLRRRSRTIFAVDASVDSRRLGNLLRMIALARSELGVEFRADGSLLDSVEPVLRIPFVYPDDTATSPANYLILLRTHINARMPSDLVALAIGRDAFPRHATLNQFLMARDVDAYVALGRWLFKEGVLLADLPPLGPQLEPSGHVGTVTEAVRSTV